MPASLLTLCAAPAQLRRCERQQRAAPREERSAERAAAMMQRYGAPAVACCRRQRLRPFRYRNIYYDFFALRAMHASRRCDDFDAAPRHAARSAA